MILQHKIEIDTRGRGTTDLTEEIQRAIRNSGVRTGLASIFIHHTSASLMICENADPTVRRDLETFMIKVAPDGDPGYEHDSEGPDDMPSHIRSMLTGSHLSVPITGGRMSLGTWQGIYVWEHRHRGHRRRLTVTVMGEA